jgi:hypothetical protein
MRARISARLVMSGMLLVSAFALVIWSSGLRAIESALSGLLFSSIVLVVILLFDGVVLSSLRLKLITSDLGYRLSFRDAVMTLSVGQLAGSVFFQFAGQLIGRSAVLSRKGIPPAATVVISGYERLTALSVSLLLAGLGAYMNDQIRNTGTPLVIHSTPVWLLAETGITGFIVFLAAAWRLFYVVVQRRREPAALLLFLMLCTLAVMSFVHGLMYQRAFWILLGAVLAMPSGTFWRTEKN